VFTLRPKYGLKMNITRRDSTAIHQRDLENLTTS
jgi:hypothetical protein